MDFLIAGKEMEVMSKSLQLACIALLGLVVLFLISVNLLPGFAYHANKIPVIGSLVSVGLYDKEIIGLSQGEHGQAVNKSLALSAAEFTVLEAVTTEGKTVLNCTMQWYGDIDGVPFITLIDVCDADNPHIQLCSGMVWNYDENSKKSTGTIELPPIDRKSVV
jgi:hypothetical protein